ncbi:MAG: class I tRNA ligase family protein, partial [Bacteroidota bacterium]|nr:class I tRNA ligase family protein [Bacteroidota bacterium]
SVLCDPYVSAESGTGIVPNSPAFGEDDERICKAAGLPIDVCPLDESGKFTSIATDFAGQYIKDADSQIIKDLKSRHLLLRHDTLDHSYPFCPRTNTPLIYRSVPSWFVNVTEIKAKMLKNNQAINWVPDHIQSGRFGKWLENARDWSISRNRVWGNPIPVWINDHTGQRICIGSIEELTKYTGKTDITDIHREFIDDLTFQIDGEAGTYHRTKEVLDCWFESGAMPYAQLHYPFENKSVFESGFPAQFIAEGLDQTRGWFYTLHVIASALFDQPAFKNVIVNGIILAESGKKMSKSLKNYTPPQTLIDQYGADALRLYMISGGLVKGEEQRFSDQGVKEMLRRTLIPWLNAFNFLTTYTEIDGWQP